MTDRSSEREGVPGIEAMSVEDIVLYAKNMAEQYRADLLADLEDFPLADLGEISKADLRRHIVELDTLMAIAEQIAEDPSRFEIVSQERKLRQVEGDPRVTYAIRLAPKGLVLPTDPENPQTQFNMFVNTNSALETESEALYALSLRGKAPDRVLQQGFKDSPSSFITMNTLGVYVDHRGDVKLNIGSGVTFRWRLDDAKARVGGVSYIGNKPHIRDLGHSMKSSDYIAMQSSIRGEIGKSFPTKR